MSTAFLIVAGYYSIGLGCFLYCLADKHWSDELRGKIEAICPIQPEGINALIVFALVLAAPLWPLILYETITRDHE